MPRFVRNVHARFWKKVRICKHGRTCQSCCWEWQASNSQGYGCFAMPPHLRPGHTPVVRATRVCWWLTHGAWPTDQHVLHTCDNPPCVQPAHLWLGLQPDNHADALAKGRLRQGERNPAAKLTPELVRQIRALAAQGYSNPKIKEILQLAIGSGAVWKISTGQRWTHIK